MENRGVRSVHLVGAVNAPRTNDADWRFAGEHGARLHRGRAQNDIILNVERILRVAGGMVLRQVEQFEVEQIQFHFRAFHNVKTHAGEDLQELILHQRDRMNGADRRVLARLGYVDRFAFKFLSCSIRLILASSASICSVSFSRTTLIIWRPSGAPLRELAHRAEHQRQIALFCPTSSSEGRPAGFVANAFKLAGGFLLNFAQLFLHVHVVCILLLFEKKKPRPQRDEAGFPRGTTQIHLAPRGARSLDSVTGRPSPPTYQRAAPE